MVDFRVDEAVIISLERVMQDGTKIRARAGSSSFRREQTVKEKLTRVKELVEQDTQGDGGKQRQRAQERARREQADEWRKRRSTWRSGTKCRTEQERERARVSVSEPEARIIKHGDNREWVLEERLARASETLQNRLSRG